MAMITAKKGVEDVAGAPAQKIRIKLTSHDVAKLESVCRKLKHQASERSLVVAGPVRLPVRELNITTRKTPCGNGTNSWDRYTMRIHSRIIELHASVDMVRSITAINIEAGVVVDVKVILRKRRRFIHK